jgi:hypothetical protein
MARKEGIKKRYIRNWSEYNERLVRRGEIYINLDFVENWDKEIKEQNAGKKGRPYIYPEAFIRFSAIIYEIFHLPYRQMEGFYRKLSQYVSKIKAADYTTLFRRIQKLNIGVPEVLKEDVVIAIDSTGIKVTNRGEWLREKWKIHRGWLKVHIAVDIRTKKILGIEVTDERVSDSRMYFLAKAMNLNIEYSFIVALVSISAIATIIPISIGGLGVREGVFVFLLASIGISKEKAVLLSLLDNVVFLAIFIVFLHLCSKLYFSLRPL